MSTQFGTKYKKDRKSKRQAVKSSKGTARKQTANTKSRNKRVSNEQKMTGFKFPGT